MMNNPDVTVGINEESQEADFMNATLQGFGEKRAISIAVHLPDGIENGVDADDQGAMERLIAGIFASAIAAGCTVEAQVGPSRDAMEADLDDEAETNADDRS